MKYLYITFALFITFLIFSWNVDAISIEVTEKVPGANCSAIWEGLYSCDPGRWFESVTQVLGAMVKYFTYIAALSAVLFIIINGILYSMSGIDAGLKDGAKKRIIKTLIGLVILLLSGVILNAIAPWIYTA